MQLNFNKKVFLVRCYMEFMLYNLSVPRIFTHEQLLVNSSKSLFELFLSLNKIKIIESGAQKLVSNIFTTN